MHLTESHVYAFKRITRVCIEWITRTHLTESHMYAFNRITMCMHLTESQRVCI